MSLTLGRQGGIAQPLKKRTVGQTNIAHVYGDANHIWPTSVIHFSDFTSVQLRYIWGSDDGRDLDTKSYYVNSPIEKLNSIGAPHEMDVVCSNPECNHEWTLDGLRYDPSHFFAQSSSIAR